MQITIERMIAFNFQIEVEEEETIESIKMKIYIVVSIPPDQQRLVYQGEDMVDKTISDYNIQMGSIIHLSIWSSEYGAWREI